MMEVTLLSARLLLALVFLVASVAKLADWVGARQALMDLGLPAPTAAPVKIRLPLAELVGAATLTPSGAATVPA
jgi:uncharacterized membrane protein YphA (DoxX/SURF4 family)